jgi:ADP-ribosylglycohydrolase
MITTGIPWSLYGAAIGDICGSVYEFHNFKTDKPEEIPLINEHARFTDDTVCTVAIAEAAATDRDYKKSLLKWTRKYPKAGYAGMFKQWSRSDDPQPYGSWGNGSAMRVSPVGWMFGRTEERPAENLADRETPSLPEGWLQVQEEAERTAMPTHNDPDGIKGAQAVASAVFLARSGFIKPEIREVIEKTYGYNLNRRLDDIRPDYYFNVSCMFSVPEAIIAFLESWDFESAIRLAISLGGDSDTIACIAGSIAEAYYREIPQELKDFARRKLPLEMQEVLGITEEPTTEASMQKAPQAVLPALEPIPKEPPKQGTLPNRYLS